MTTKNKITITIGIAIAAIIIIGAGQQLANAATYKDPQGRFTIGYRDGWIPQPYGPHEGAGVTFNSTDQQQFVSVSIIKHTSSLTLYDLTKMMESDLESKGDTIIQPTQDASNIIEGSQTFGLILLHKWTDTNKIFKEYILLADMGDNTIEIIYRTSSPAIFDQGVHDVLVPMAKSFLLIAF